MKTVILAAIISLSTVACGGQEPTTAEQLAAEQDELGAVQQGLSCLTEAELAALRAAGKCGASRSKGYCAPYGYYCP